MDDFDISQFDKDIQLRMMAMKMALAQWGADEAGDIALAADIIYQFLKDGSTPE